MHYIQFMCMINYCMVPRRPRNEVAVLLLSDLDATQLQPQVISSLLLAVLQAAVMIPLVLTLICGFASTLYVVYRKMYPEYSTMLGALRMMAVLTLGGHHLLLVSAVCWLVA